MTRQGRPATPPCQPPSPAAPPGTSGHRAESPGGVRAPRSPLPLFRPLGPAPRSPTACEKGWHMLRGKRAGGGGRGCRVTADHVGGCGLARRLPLKGGTAVPCEPPPPTSTAIAGKRKNDFALLLFGGTTCKERLSERSARTIHYGKICSLVTPSDESGSRQTGALGAEHGAHRRPHAEPCPSLGSLVFEFVIVIMALLKILTK